MVDNYVYSLLLGMPVPDVSGKAIANLEVESLRHVASTIHGDTIYSGTTVLDKRESGPKPARRLPARIPKGRPSPRRRGEASQPWVKARYVRVLWNAGRLVSRRICSAPS